MFAFGSHTLECSLCSSRVSDSDDLKMTESEVARLAVAIEKEMFHLCLSTDSKYKNKYRSLMFNLKDPKNKVSRHKPIKAPTCLTRVREEKKRKLSVLCFVSGFVLQGDWGRGQPLQAGETKCRGAAVQGDIRVEEA